MGAEVGGRGESSRQEIKKCTGHEMRTNVDISEMTGMECVKWQLVVSL